MPTPTIPVIGPDSSREEIKGYQSKLQLAGKYLGTVDGIWGPQTQRAHEAYLAMLLPPAPADSGSLEAVRSGILLTARHFLDLSETAPNRRWDHLAGGKPTGDPRGDELREKLLATGWQLSWAYCIAFVEVCWRAGYKLRPELALISRLITLSVMESYDNFKRAGKTTHSPTPGAIMFMQHGDSDLGHAGIVTAPAATFHTIEGNTSSNENSREGDGVYAKSHALDFSRKSGLHLIGFANPFLV